MGQRTRQYPVATSPVGLPTSITRNNRPTPLLLSTIKRLQNNNKTNKKNTKYDKKLTYVVGQYT